MIIAGLKLGIGYAKNEGVLAVWLLVLASEFSGNLVCFRKLGIQRSRLQACVNQCNLCNLSEGNVI